MIQKLSPKNETLLHEMQEEEYVKWMKGKGSELEEEYRHDWQYGTGEDIDED